MTICLGRHSRESGRRATNKVTPNHKRGFERNCVFAAYTLLGLVLSLAFMSPVQADQVCLRIALPEIHVDEQKLELYRQVMEDAGLCVRPVALPQIRAFSEIRSGEIDGVFAARDDLPEQFDVPMVHGEVVLGRLKGFLVVRNGPIADIQDLNNEVLGVPLGATWPEKLIANYPNVAKVPKGADMLKQMLQEGRIDAMLLDAYSLEISGGVPDGFKAVPVDEFLVYSWLKAEFAYLMPRFDTATANYLRIVNP